ncbi:hypothetical protein [Paucilactobacillus wasatchensis]|uniref:Uncharacterized protein n=1 Tax=Paucilactobacillus wasatchensis TaxID=1335616 RepID=A0A0D1A8Z1_9LACO|nr:hypothetical protein [Paucilactobacillus wasatchensis]KIS04122.1 hypothetical protein WDC_0324 [Paucilactobacillus wasatchensis]
MDPFIIIVLILLSATIWQFYSDRQKKRQTSAKHFERNSFDNRRA